MDGEKIKVAILGSGNIGTDLLFKLLNAAGAMELAVFAGIDPSSDGLARARAHGLPTSHAGVEAILADPDIRIVFDATSAKAHVRHAKLLREAGKTAIDLTPAARGPYVVPAANLHQHLHAPNVNLITCGGQATIPLAYAISRVSPLRYVEIVSTISSRSAGPGTRHNIDEFTFTTARGLEVIGGAQLGKAIMILNPADPPILMRNTVYAVMEADFDEAEVRASIERVVAEVQAYVPGYRLKNRPVVELRETPWGRRAVVVVLLEVAGAGDYLPPYAGNLDIMTAAALRVGELMARHHLREVAA